MSEERVDLRLEQYKVSRASFDLKDDISVSKKIVNLNPTFNRKVKKIDGDNIAISVSIEIKDESAPFEIFAEIEGVFNLKNWESSDFKKSVAIENSTAILFPYLRQIVTTLSSLGGIVPIFIPVVNTFELFNQR